MGVLRLILAFSVVAAHAPFQWPFFFMNASAAVVSFFVISGFYMALVLNEKYTDNISFFKARLLRIYPAYWFFLAISIWMTPVFDAWTMIVSAALLGREYLFLANLPDGLAMPLGQAWSLSLELQFYIVAALVFRTRTGIVMTFIAAALLRSAMQYLGYGFTPLGSWLSLNSLVFFCAGAMAYLAYDKVRRIPNRLSCIFAGLIVVALLVYLRRYEGFHRIDPNTTDPRFYPLYVGIALLTPFLFSITKDIAIDRFLGELSYTVYLCHIIVIDAANRAGYGGVFIITWTLLLAALSVLLIEIPVQRTYPKNSRAFLLTKRNHESPNATTEINEASSATPSERRNTLN